MNDTDAEVRTDRETIARSQLGCHPANQRELKGLRNPGGQEAREIKMYQKSLRILNLEHKYL